jgi:hypothetical protein
MRGLVLALGLLVALATVPAVATASPLQPLPPCGGHVDTLCGDPEGQPGGTICLLAISGHCVAWT